MGDSEKLEIDVLSSSTISKRIFNESFGALPTKTESIWIGSETLGISGWYKYRCSFDLPASLDKFLYVVDHFCKMFQGDARIDADALMEDIVSEVESDYKYAKVHHFALGAWTGLSRFIERFTSHKPDSASRSISRIQASFFHDRRFLEIYFEDKIAGSKKNDVYKLKIAYEDITQIVLKRELRHLDAFYDISRKKEPTDVFMHVKKIAAYRWSDPVKEAYEYFFDGEWERTPNFGGLKGPTYCGCVGTANAVKLRLDSKIGYPMDAIYGLLGAASAPVYFASVVTLDMPKNPQPLAHDKASPDIRWALSCIHSLSPEISLKMALEGNSKEIQETLVACAKEDSSSLARALYDIYFNLCNYPLIDMKLAIKDSFSSARKGKSSRTSIINQKLPQDLYLVKRAIVCPSKTIVKPPTVVRVSALLRSVDPEKVMLVDVRDDDGTRLRFNTQNEARTFIQVSIAEKIKRGIKIAGKTYYFLGNSKSQAEDFSFWAYAIEKGDTDTISSVRERLGITGNLARRIAVQDLVFAEALGAVSIDPSWVSEESEDVPAASDFKHGIGRISEAALRTVVENCHWSRTLCSAIRVIHGGRRGTLVYDPSLEGSRIIYRKSQTVIRSEDSTLYLIGRSEMKNAAFDRTLISTLSSKADGLTEEFSVEDFLTPLYELLTEPLSLYSTGARVKRVAAEPVLDHIFRKGEDLYGYDKRGDGLFRQAVRCKALKALRDLKKLKQHMTNAYEIMPVVDELGLLEEGEVFIQVSSPGGDLRVLSGDLVLARKDAMHLEEFRRVTAVNRPDVVGALGHLFNCVVLPSKGGSRPLEFLAREASYAGESDIILIASHPDEEPAFLFKRNDPPRSTSIAVGSEVDASCDTETHYFNYLAYVSFNDFEEVFCALADSLPQHASSESCIRVGVQRRLLDKYRRGGREVAPLPKVVNFPHFLEKISDRRTYCSARPLGHIYRKGRLIDTEYFEDTQMMTEDLTFQHELRVEGSEAFAEIAARDIRQFRGDLEGIASLYGISVDEVLTGTIFSDRGQHSSNERRSDIEAAVKLQVKHLALICRRKFKKGMEKASELEVLQKISAYYVASRDFPKDGGYAFPWMLPDLMQGLIAHLDPQPPPIPESEVSRKLLASVAGCRAPKLTTLTNIHTILDRWIRVNKNICAVSRGDSEYFSDKFCDFVEQAHGKAFEKLVGPEDKVNCSPQLINNPLGLLAETLRHMLFVSAKDTDKKFGREQLFMMSLQTLLLNTLAKITATCSLRSLLDPTKILRDTLVSHRILLPLSMKDDKYIRATQGDLQKCETKLCEMTGCRRARIRLVPRLETSECDYEEIIATGTWFTVANLEYVVLQPDYRAILINIFRNNERLGLQALRLADE
ncbi:RNA-dependent RNA polymerase 1 [Galendromus occidentalis]|uniref:RNA-dependent RNA polymerase n=1 Tax=Galendromus occidentalis TaxID=34638 RepID=A0AAJ6QWI0_9ACAR|nr:RNA-dependent RNA polymerase 1 [Galendromus occidentalis]